MERADSCTSVAAEIPDGLGKPQDNGGALAKRALDADAATRLVGEATRHRQAEACALAARLRCEERLARSCKRSGIHARARVRNCQLQIVTRRQTSRMRIVRNHLGYGLK